VHDHVIRTTVLGPTAFPIHSNALGNADPRLEVVPTGPNDDLGDAIGRRTAAATRGRAYLTPRLLRGGGKQIEAHGPPL